MLNHGIYMNLASPDRPDLFLDKPMQRYDTIQRRSNPHSGRRNAELDKGQGGTYETKYPLLTYEVERPVEE